ncbi:Mlp2 protein [Maudiozyma humilis]|uniref:Mlp2 protein n=1 Tax=Maudiozyma humilis TaxID=51915 RepID=A0AAV5RPN9_MAUHU|nr:Mlp2 protein [Kazachstania humilis]
MENTEQEVRIALCNYLGVPLERLGSVDIELSNIILQKLSALKDIQSNNDQLTAEIQQTRHQRDTDVEKLNKELKESYETNASLNEKDNNQKIIADRLSQEIHNNETLIDNCKSQIEELKKANEESKIYSLSLQKIIDDSSAFNAKYNTDDSTNVQLITELRGETIALGGAVEKMREEMVYQGSELARKDEEIALLVSQRAWLENQLKHHSLNAIAHDESKDSLSDVVAELTQTKDDNRLLKSTQDQLQQKNKTLSLEIERLARELKEEKDNAGIEKASLERELHSREQLFETLSEQTKKFEEGHNSLSNITSDVQERERLISELSGTKSKLQDYKEKFEKLECIVNDLIGNDSVVAGFNTSEDLLSSLKMSDKSQIVDLQKKLLQEKQHKEDIQRELQVFVNEMESKIPLLENFEKRAAELEAQLLKTSEALRTTSEVNRDLTIRAETLAKKHENKDMTLKTLRVQRSDLARQVQLLLSIIPDPAKGSHILSNDDIYFVKKLLQTENTNDYDDSQRVITENFVDIRNIRDVQTRNMELMEITRNLAAQLEERERNKSAGFTQKTLSEANAAISNLQRHSKSLENRINELTVERDTLNVLVHSINNNGRSDSNDHTVLEEKQGEIDELKAALQKKEDEKDETISKLNTSIAQYTDELRTTKLMLEKLEVNAQGLKEENETLTTKLQMAEKSRTSVCNEFQKLQAVLTDMTTEKSNILNEITSLKEDKAQLQSEQEKFTSDKSELMSANQSLQNDLIALHEERNQLKIQIGELDNIRFRLESNNIAFLEKETILKTEIENLRKQFISQDDAIKEVERARNTEISWFKTELENINNLAEERQKNIQQLESDNKNILKEQDDLKDCIVYFGLMKAENKNGANSSEFATYPYDKTREGTDLSRDAEFQILLDKARKDSDVIRSALVSKSQTLEGKITELEENAKKLEQFLSTSNQQKEILKGQLNELDNVIREEQSHLSSVSPDSQLLVTAEDSNADPIVDKKPDSNGEISTQNELDVIVDDVQTESNTTHSRTTELINLLHSKENLISSLQKSLNSKEEENIDLNAKYSQMKMNESQYLATQDNDRDAQNNLQETINRLQSEIQAREEENRDLDDKFNRLKKQAHERLDSNKTITNQLNEEISDLKTRNEELLAQLNGSLSDNLGVRLESGETEGTPNLATAELPTSEKAIDTQQLLDEIDHLKAKLSILEAEGHTSELAHATLVSTGVKDITSQQDTTSAKQVIADDRAESPIEDTINTPGFSKIELENMKRKWQEEWEVETNKRIENAKEELKKHLRQPAETKINRVIEKRKQELEDDFETKVKEKAESIVLSKTFDLTADQIKDKMSQDMKSEMQKEMEELRKKSFEEGRQQESMKTMLLQRKLSKLEGAQTATPKMDDSKATGTRMIDQLAPLTNQESIKERSPSMPETAANVSVKPVLTEEKRALFVPPSFSSSQLGSPPSNPFTFSSKKPTVAFGSASTTKSPFQSIQSQTGTQWTPFSNDSSKRTFAQSSFGYMNKNLTGNSNEAEGENTDDDRDSQSPKRAKTDE